MNCRLAQAWPISADGRVYAEKRLRHLRKSRRANDPILTQGGSNKKSQDSARMSCNWNEQIGGVMAVGQKRMDKKWQYKR